MLNETGYVFFKCKSTEVNEISPDLLIMFVIYLYSFYIIILYIYLILLYYTHFHETLTGDKSNTPQYTYFQTERKWANLTIPHFSIICQTEIIHLYIPFFPLLTLLLSVNNPDR